MTVHAGGLEAFYRTVVRVLREKYTWVHWPEYDCFNGLCKGFRLSNTDPPVHPCSWEDVAHLVKRFFRRAPVVDAIWKSDAKDIGLDPDTFHDLMLGVFIGSQKPSPSPVRRAFENGGTFTVERNHPLSNAIYFPNILKETV